MGILRDDDLDPDGIRMVVDWDAMRVHNSVFIPCINTTRAIRTAKGAMKRRGWKPRFKICHHNGILGVRVWRIT